jgi:hypothetical protein
MICLIFLYRDPVRNPPQIRIMAAPVTAVPVPISFREIPLLFAIAFTTSANLCIFTVFSVQKIRMVPDSSQKSVPPFQCPSCPSQVSAPSGSRRRFHTHFRLSGADARVLRSRNHLKPCVLCKSVRNRLGPQTRGAPSLRFPASRFEFSAVSENLEIIAAFWRTGSPSSHGQPRKGRRLRPF